MDPTSDSSLSTRRRAICQRILARNASGGIVLDDPAFLRIMEAWIAGEIEMREATAHWHNVRLSRSAERRGTAIVTDSAGSTPAPFVASEEHEEEEIDPSADGQEEPEWIRAMSARKRER
jgi:hypothetical protein